MSNMNKSLILLMEEMSRCEQMKNLSVLEHGISVHEHFLRLVDFLENRTENEFSHLKILFENRKFFLKELSKYSKEDVYLYQVFHDCGKPKCLEIDENGKKHFSNHAEVSGNLFFELTGNKLVSNLILHDMDFHLSKSEDIDEIFKLEFWPILLLTSFAEVESNSKIFGGQSSDSYKMKSKKLIQRTKQILKT